MGGGGAGVGVHRSVRYGFLIWIMIIRHAYKIYHVLRFLATMYLQNDV